ncbi:MAG: hypothetical protein RL497_1770 [Pseudomonadota bacterium]
MNPTHEQIHAAFFAHAPELLDAVPMGILLLNTDGVIVYCNSEAARLFAYSPPELMGMSVEALMPPEFRQHHVALRQTYLSHATPRFMGMGRDLYGQRSDGSQFPLEIGLRPLSCEGQNYVIASVIDVTERKKIHEQLSAIIEASPYGQIVVDKNGIIKLVNNGSLQIFGFKREELLEQPLEILLPERYRHGHQNMIQQFFQQPSLRKMGAGRDLTGRHKSGREIPIEIGLAPLEFPGDIHVLAGITDITLRKRLESNLRESNAQLEEFTFVLSHDLKSPLRGISDLTEWIAEDLGADINPDVAHNLERIRARITRMEVLTEDLLLYARAAKRSHDVVLIKFPEIITNILELVGLPEQAQVVTNFLEPELTTAKTPIETVLRNLISNAVKHHDKQKPLHLTISTDAVNSFVRIRVQDNGPGIPANARERVFRLFQTLQGSSSTHGGMGLAVAKRLSEAHGGRINLEDNENATGCCFSLWWPRFLRSDLDDE